MKYPKIVVGPQPWAPDDNIKYCCKIIPKRGSPKYLANNGQFVQDHSRLGYLANSMREMIGVLKRKYKVRLMRTEELYIHQTQLSNRKYFTFR